MPIYCFNIINPKNKNFDIEELKKFIRKLYIDLYNDICKKENIKDDKFSFGDKFIITYAKDIQRNDNNILCINSNHVKTVKAIVKVNNKPVSNVYDYMKVTNLTYETLNK